MEISNIYAQNSAEWAKKASVDSHSNNKKANSEPKGKATSSAQVSISENAGKSNSAEALVKERANALPEVREEKVALAKERIGSNYYNTPEFSKELATRLLNG